MITAELHDGRVLEFPDGTDPAVVQRVVKQTLGIKEGPERSLSNYVKAGAEGLAQQTKDLIGGAVRGAGSIGSTLLAPMDMLNQVLLEQRGMKPGNLNQQRRQDITEGTRMMGADPESMTYGAGKLASEIAGVSGIGPALAGLGRATPIATKAPNVLEAIATSGMRGGGVVPRAVGGAITGGASAGLVNPEDAAMGAAVGGALPGAVMIGGNVGNAAGRLIRGPEQTPDLVEAINAARGSGYVIPPSQAKPSLFNRTLEGLSGKITTAQNASAKNQVVTNAKAAAAVGLPVDEPITVDALKAVRDTAGKAYSDLGATGMITPRQPYFDALDKIAEPYKLTAGAFPNAKPSPVLELVDSLRSPAFASASAVEKIKQLRTAADDAFRSGNTDIGRAAKSAAKALEDAVEDHLIVIGEPEKLQAFREARQLIAKTYSVEKALNPSTGTIDARKLGQQITKGKPIGGELREIGNFANRFPKAAQPIEGMGSLPQTSPLDWAMGGGLAMGTGNPLMLATMAARPASRASILSPLVQDRLVQSPSLMPQLNPDLGLFGYRAAPLLFGNR